MDLIELKLNEFSEMVNSDRPAPGGGSVAAYVSNLGVSLARMMGHLTINKKKFLNLTKEEQDYFMDHFNKLEFYYNDLLSMVDEDTRVFNKVMDAYKLPKDSDDEKEIRNNAIQSATLEASISPMNAARTAYEALELATCLIENGNVNAISDLASALYLLEAGMNCSILNVKINASSLNDKNIANSFLEECEILQKKARQSLEKSITIISNLL